MESLEDIFKPYLENRTFQEIFSLVKQNSSGKIWLTGGFVYRNLAAALYGGEPYEKDIDFIVERRNDVLHEVVGWKIEVNSYGAGNYVREGKRSAFTELGKFIRASKEFPSTIEEYLLTTPFTVQSIGYDIQKNKMIGDIGIRAVRERRIAINDLPQALFYAEKKQKPLDRILREKADELGFA
jgi:hypothetical protein